MSVLRVARLGHPVLRQRALDADVADIRAGKYRQLIEDMFETMNAYQGVGLAGPQIHLPLRLFVYSVEDTVAQRRGVRAVKAGAIFNATLEPVGTDRISDWEGCLSIPFLGGEVPRYRKVRIRGLDAEGNDAAVEVDEFTARIFQHEIDHTDGMVYLDRMPDLRTLAYTANF